MNFKLSVVIPAYNEEGNIPTIVDELKSQLNIYPDYEVIFINDGSSDKTLDALRRVHQEDQRYRYLSFSRNFGHQYALRAGLDHAIGECVISMDCDLQHPPSLIHQMIEKWREGYKIVYTVRKDDPTLPFFKRFTARTFYWLINLLSEVEIKPGTADFRLLDRQVVDQLKKFNEFDLFYRGLIPWLGYKNIGIEYEPANRMWGVSQYTTKKMIRFAITGITAFSTKPLTLSIALGSIISGFSFLYGSYAILIKLFTDKAVSGWTSLLVSVLFIGGIQLIVLGVIGQYLGKLFFEAKRRPSYIIEEAGDDE